VDGDVTDEYDEMSRDELLFRLRDWRELANQRTMRIGQLEAELNRVETDAMSAEDQHRDDMDALTAERDLLKDERDLFRDQAIPEAAQILNQYSKENFALQEVVRHLETERDAWKATVAHMREDEERLWAELYRLRAVVDAAMLLWYATYPTGPATASFIEARRAFEEAAAALDGSAEATDG
jgi:chromosome segregation ATPase